MVSVLEQTMYQATTGFGIGAFLPWIALLSLFGVFYTLYKKGIEIETKHVITAAVLSLGLVWLASQLPTGLGFFETILQIVLVGSIGGFVGLGLYNWLSPYISK